MTFEFTQKHKMIAFGMMAIGIAAIATGFMTGHGDNTRAWASMLLGNFFFMAIALGATAWMAIQFVAEVGWSAMIKRIPMAIGTYLPFAAVFMLLIFIFGHHDLYHWTHAELYDKASPEFDEILNKKKAFLNVPFFTGRMVVYFLIWAGYAMLIRKWSLQEDVDGDLIHYKKSSRLSATFLVLFLVTSSTMAWDFIMSLDSHWFSTLFGWYTFAGLFVSGIATMVFTTSYLKGKGLVNYNDSHLHDIAKFMFAFSIFWTYLFTFQFLLYWYANLPEEVAYYIPRLSYYRPIFVMDFLICFIVPFLGLMRRDSKRKLRYIQVIAILVLVGHWLDMFMMIMPATVDKEWSLGFVEIGTTIGFGGVFIYTFLNALSKAPLVAKNHPMMIESEHFHL